MLWDQRGLNYNMDILKSQHITRALSYSLISTVLVVVVIAVMIIIILWFIPNYA